MTLLAKLEEYVTQLEIMVTQLRQENQMLRQQIEEKQELNNPS